MKNIKASIKKSNFNQIEIWALNLIETNQFAIQLTSNYSFFAIQFKCILKYFLEILQGSIVGLFLKFHYFLD
jgi:hypothetical protein